MQRGGRILIVLGVLLGVISFAAAFIVLSSKPTEGATPQIKTVKVVIAQQNIPLHTPIPASALTVYDWPEDVQLPRGTFTDTTIVAGRLSKTDIAIGQVVDSDMVVDKKVEETRKGLGSDASLIVPAGQVAVAFPVNQISSVSSAIKDGDRVDLMVSYNIAQVPGANQPVATVRQVTQLALQDVEILRVGSWTTAAAANDAAPQAAGDITFLVNRQDALVLKFLRETSTEVQLALRAAGDHEIVKTEPVIVDYIDTRFGFNGMLTGHPH